MTTAAPSTGPNSPDSSPAEPATNLAYTILLGLTALAVLLQGLWAGIFLEHDGKRDQASTWVDVHSVGGDIAVLLALAALVVSLLRLPSRQDLRIGTAVLFALLLIEALLGSLISNGHDTLTAIHVPLAMLIMGLVVWLPLRVRQSSSG